jgi:hypothetical protein
MNVTYELYMDQGNIPTVDRPKVIKPSELFVWDNKCSALDAEWECLPYAQASCEQYRGTEGYLQCTEDRFRACRSAAGCDYRYNTSPGMCGGTPGDLEGFHRAVDTVCNDPSKEFPSRESYNACVEKMWEWSQKGCVNIGANEVSGEVVGLAGW